ncbi:hypothetical protein Tco_0270940 [Tanacetum coccineum]
MVYQLTKFHVQRVDMVINPPWNLPFLGAKGLTSPEQTATGKGISNPFMAVMVCQKPYGIQLTNSEWLTGKETSNPFKIFNDSPLTGVNTPGSDENRLKLYDLIVLVTTNLTPTVVHDSEDTGKGYHTKRQKTKKKMTKPGTEWKSCEGQSQRPEKSKSKSTQQININKSLKKRLVRHGTVSRISFEHAHITVLPYNGLNPSDQDSLNSATGGNLLERCAQDIASAVASAVTSVMTAMFKQHQVTLAPAMYCLIMKDTFSCKRFVVDCKSPYDESKIMDRRFSWVFFLASKDETSGILQNFIRQIENQLSHKGLNMAGIAGFADVRRDRVYIYTEASIRDKLQLADASGIAMLPNDEIFEGMGQMGYPTDGTFTFWKSFFTPQWRYLVHHLLHCISSKSGGWDQFGSNIATALICLSTGRVYNFSKLIFDGMVANLKSKTKFLMYPRFLQLILDIQTENKHPYLSVTLTKKIFENMKRGFRGAPRPSLPAMLLVATTNLNAVQSPPPIRNMKRGFRGAPRPLLPTMLLVATNPNAVQEHDAVAPSQPTSSSPPVPSTSSPPVITTPTPIVKLVKKVKNQDDPLDSSVQGLVTPSTTKVNVSGEEQVEDISPNTLEAAKTLSKVAYLKPRSIDKGRRYKRRKEAKGKKVVSSLDFQEEVDTGAKQVNTSKGFNTGSIKLSTVSEQLSTGSEQVSTVGAKKYTSAPDKGQREGKAPMISEETPKKSKEQILQEEANEDELNELQKKRRAQVQFEAQHYTDEDWDLIRAKIEANAELSKSMLGSDLQGEDFAKKMVDLVNQRKKYFAEERARAKRNKPMTQSQLKTYMMNYLKNQGTWKLSQLKNLSFEEVKEEFDKLVKQVESFAPINFEATKASLKRFDLDKDDSEGSDEVSEQDDSVTGHSSKDKKDVMNRYGMDGPEEQTALGKDSLIRSMGAKGLTSPEQTATGKGISNPFMAVMVCKNIEHQSDTQVISVSWNLLELHQQAYGRFYTLAGNPVKEILLKLNLPDHRSILTDSKITIDGGEVPDSSDSLDSISTCSYPTRQT